MNGLALVLVNLHPLFLLNTQHGRSIPRQMPEMLSALPVDAFSNIHVSIENSTQESRCVLRF